jgi:hypothetical protein
MYHLLATREVRVAGQVDCERRQISHRPPSGRNLDPCASCHAGGRHCSSHRTAPLLSPQAGCQTRGGKAKHYLLPLSAPCWSQFNGPKCPDQVAPRLRLISTLTRVRLRSKKGVCPEQECSLPVQLRTWCVVAGCILVPYHTPYHTN